MKYFQLLIVIAFIAAQAACSNERSRSSNERAAHRGVADPVQLTDDNFEREVLKSQQPVLVDMWAQWCNPCVKMKPTIKELAAEFAGEARVGELDVDANPFIAEKYDVKRYPTLILFYNGKEVDRLVGMKTKKELTDLLHNITDAKGGAG